MLLVIWLSEPQDLHALVVDVRAVGHDRAAAVRVDLVDRHVSHDQVVVGVLGHDDADRVADFGTGVGQHPLVDVPGRLGAVAVIEGVAGDVAGVQDVRVVAHVRVGYHGQDVAVVQDPGVIVRVDRQGVAVLARHHDGHGLDLLLALIPIRRGNDHEDGHPDEYGEDDQGEKDTGFHRPLPWFEKKRPSTPPHTKVILP